MASRGFEIKLIGLGEATIDGIECQIFPRRNRLSYLRYLGAAVRAARQFEPHLLHLHSISGFGLWGIGAGMRPTLATAFGSDVVSAPRNPLLRFAARRVLATADAVTATSEHLKRRITGLQPAAAGKVSIVPFGVDLPEKPIPWPASEPVRMCYLKYLRPVYGPDVLIEAMRLVHRSHPTLQLTLGGSGQMLDKLQALAKKYDLSSVVTFAGRIPPEKAYDFIAHHHALVMPSRNESFGVVALEVGACGRPVIASNVDGIPEVVVDGETGLLVPPEEPVALAEAIIRLAEDRELAEALGKNGFARVQEHFQWDKTLDLMAELYERLIDGKKTNTPV
jgi:glycosyltransferase involved in cell wall biosynthesis